MKKIKLSKIEVFILFIIIAIGLYAGSLVWNFGMPQYFMVDEIITIPRVWDMFLNETQLTYFKYPGLNFYYGFIALKLLDTLPGLDMGKFNESVYLIRFIYNGSAVLSFLFFYAGVKKLYKSKVMAIAGLCLAVFSLYYAQFIYYAGPDSLTIIFSNIIFFIAVYAYKTPGTKAHLYLLLAVAIGFIVSAKYHGVILGSYFIFLHMVKRGYKNRKDNLLLLSCGFIAATVFILCNYTVIFHIKDFIEDLLFNLNNYSHNTIYSDATWNYFTNNAFITYVKSLFLDSYGIIGAILTIIGIISFMWNKRYLDFIFIVMNPVILLVILGGMTWFLERNFSFCIIYFILLMLEGISAIAGWFRKFDALVVLTITGVLCVLNLYTIVKIFSLPELRNIAQVWIDENIPQGAIIYEPPSNSKGYTPYINQEKYQIKYVNQVPDVLNENEYYIDTEYQYGRWYQYDESWFGKGDLMTPDKKEEYDNAIKKLDKLIIFESDFTASMWKDERLSDYSHYLFNRDMKGFIGPDIRIFKGSD